jgi:hypothetical protein
VGSLSLGRRVLDAIGGLCRSTKRYMTSISFRVVVVVVVWEGPVL